MDNIRNYGSLQATVAMGDPEDVDIIAEQAGKIRLAVMTLSQSPIDREEFWDRFGEIAEFLYGVVVPGGRLVVHVPAWDAGRTLYVPDRLRMAIAPRGWSFIDEMVMGTVVPRDPTPRDRMVMAAHDFFLAFSRDAAEGEGSYRAPLDGRRPQSSVIVVRPDPDWPPTNPPMISAWQHVYRAYSSPGDLICDPLCVYAGTLVAAALQGSSIVAACPSQELYSTVAGDIDSNMSDLEAILKMERPRHG